MKIALLILCIYAAYKIVKGGYLSTLSKDAATLQGIPARVKAFLAHVF